MRSKSLTYTKIPQKLKICQKWFLVHLLELFAADTRSFQLKALACKKLVTLSEKGQFIWANSFGPIRTVASVIRIKSLTYTIIPQKKLKICQKWFRVYSLELFPANTRSFQAKTFFSKKLLSLSEEAQFIWANSESRFGHKNQKFDLY